MKAFRSIGISVIMLSILFLVSGGSVLAHSLCGHCNTYQEINHVPAHNGCCHQRSPADDCYCEYAYFSFEAERAHGVKSNQNTIVAKPLVAAAPGWNLQLISSSFALRAFPPLLPPLLVCGGRHVLAMCAILII